MRKEQVYIIIASQDFQSANHRNLWIDLAEQSGCHVYVANIVADYVTSTLRHKQYRIKEAKSGPVNINEHLTVFRPLVVARPEVLPDGWFPMVRSGFWKSMKQIDPKIFDKQVNLIVYNAYWVQILEGSHPDMKIAYYLFDEVRYNAKDNSLNKIRFRYDEYACRHADVVYTMTKVLAKSRAEYNNNVHVMGNGSILPAVNDIPLFRFPRSVAFIGNFRDWIDEALLESIIESKPDVLFVFAGPVEANMKVYFNYLLDNYDNTIYFGQVSKDRMTVLYRMFNMVIIPYHLNPFIQATRPIKIVESVLAGTPVVTIPMDGYDECEFIRFASDRKTFCNQIDFLLEHPIDQTSDSYVSFCNDNIWSSISKRIINTFER